jgi:hypothetical protein
MLPMSLRFIQYPLGALPFGMRRSALCPSALDLLREPPDDPFRPILTCLDKGGTNRR